MNESIKTNEDILVGSGELYNVKNFIKDIFTLYNKNLDEYILTDNKNNLNNKRNGYYSCKKYSNYNDLLNLSIKDIYEYKVS